MSDPRIVEVEKWQRLYFAAIFVAISSYVVQVATELDWLSWPRMLAWLGAAAASVLEGRARRRLGEDGSWAVLRGLMCVAFAVLAML